MNKSKIEQCDSTWNPVTGCLQMNEFETRKMIHEELEKCGIKVPIEEKFDYTGIEQPEKVKKFIKLIDGKLSNAIYVSKQGERYGDNTYFDLVFAVDEKGAPICVPVPIIRKLFEFDKKQWPMGVIEQYCKDSMQGEVYEYIYKAYYENGQLWLPF